MSRPVYSGPLVSDWTAQTAQTARHRLENSALDSGLSALFISTDAVGASDAPEQPMAHTPALARLPDVFSITLTVPVVRKTTDKRRIRECGRDVY
jgi:hypothetical protein